MPPDVTVLSFSSPLLRAVLRLERGCFLSGLPSTGAALSGFTGWGLRRQKGEALRGVGSSITETGWGAHQHLTAAAPHQKASGQLPPVLLSRPSSLLHHCSPHSSPFYSLRRPAPLKGAAQPGPRPSQHLQPASARTTPSASLPLPHWNLSLGD